MANNRDKEVTGWVGWIYFAGFMMFITGIFQMISGFTALLNDKYFLVRENTLVVFNFTAWGWIHLLLGLVILLAGMAVINGHFWGRVIAVFLAMISMVANFVFVAAYPVWSILAIIADGLIIYALTVHGRELED